MFDPLRRGMFAWGVAVSFTAFAVAPASPGLADSRGPKVKVEDNGDEYKYEFKDRGCEYKYEFKYKTGEEKIEEKGRCRGLVPAPQYRQRAYIQPRAVPPAPTGGLIGCNREILGGVIGGVVGGVSGAQVGKGSGKTAATIGGAIAGVLVGGAIGRSMDQLDQACVAQALEYAPSNRTIAWENPEHAVAYEVRPVRSYQARSGRYCREYTTTATIAGARQRVHGTACRQPDGSWQIVS